MGRLLRTLLRFRFGQLAWRARYSIERRANIRNGTSGRRWQWPRSGRPGLRKDFPPLPNTGLPAAVNQAHTVSLLAEGRFEHVGAIHDIGLERPDWHLGAITENRLWAIGLHYHQWAYSLARATLEPSSGDRAAHLFRVLIGDWIDRARLEQPGSTALAWNSYAIATRLGWWIRSYRLASTALFVQSPRLEERFLASAWQQAAFLADHLEWDLRANHLLRNLVGLALAGRFFDSQRAAGWLTRAFRLLPEQIEEQVLGDGGHFERSASYQIEVIDDLRTLEQLTANSEDAKRLRTAIGKLTEHLAWICHPDGDVVQFNDGSRVSKTRVDAALLPAVHAPTEGGRFFPDTGLAAWHGDPWTAFFDVGPVGAECQPAHGHADTLSLEVSFHGQRLIVDPGTFAYDDRRRRDNRSTAAHNTVTIDGADSSEMWKIFRVGRRAVPFDVEVKLGSSSLVAGGCHDGYDHLPGRPRHHRRLTVENRKHLTLVDTVTGRGEHTIAASFLIEPGWTIVEKMVPKEGMGWLLSKGKSVVEIEVECPAELDLRSEPRWQHPDYGVERATTGLGWQYRGRLPVVVRTVLRVPIDAHARHIRPASRIDRG